jgi:uncharacterized glyoxalase superfamily protein PhnB
MIWQRSDPIYPVNNVAASIEWYRRVFGFEPTVVNPPDDEPVYAVMARDGIAIHLMSKDEAPHGLTGPVETQFWVSDDVDVLFEQVKAQGVTVVQALSDQQWGHRDFMVADLDQNVVWVTQRLASIPS